MDHPIVKILYTNSFTYGELNRYVINYERERETHIISRFCVLQRDLAIRRKNELKKISEKFFFETLLDIEKHILDIKDKFTIFYENTPQRQEADVLS